MGILSSNPVITFAGFCVVPLLWKLLWRSGEPAVLLFCAMFQWAQAFTPVVSADIEGLTLDEVFRGPQLEWAAWASLGSVLVLSVGMSSAKSVFSRLQCKTAEMRAEAEQINVRRLAFLYLFLLVVSFCIAFMSAYAGGLRQPLLAFAYVKWIPIVLLAWVTFQQRKQPVYLVSVVVIEVILGFTGYFSSFKSVIFVLMLVSMGVAIERGKFRVFPLVMSLIFVLPLIGFWQAVKTDYRNYLNQGTGQQAVLVSATDRLVYLARSVERVEAVGIVNGLSRALDRLGYIDYFALAIIHVPDRIPHENGGLWIGAIEHILMPRVLFPGKATLNESERTNKYTLAKVAGEREGTAVSLGYPAESYIDFGFVGMYVPIFLLGLLFGWTYLWFSSRGPHYIFGNALATSLLLFSGHQLEQSNIKIVGGLVAGILAFMLVQRFAVAWMWRYCLTRPA